MNTDRLKTEMISSMTGNIKNILHQIDRPEKWISNIDGLNRIGELVSSIY